MAVKPNTPNIHARELRELVLAAIPELREKLGDEKQAESHRLMGALFDHATRALKTNDVSEVIRTFRFTKELLGRDRECDPYVQSAVWTSFINPIRRYEDLGLKIFRDLDPELRASLYSPFVFPHHWLREIKICLPEVDRWKTRFTIARVVEAKVRLVQQLSSRGRFAIVRLQLEPMLEDQCVLFQNMLDDSNDAPLDCLEAVIEGVTDSIESRCDATRGVSHLRIKLLELVFHAVDSSRTDFVTTANEVVESCFADAGIVEL